MTLKIINNTLLFFTLSFYSLAENNSNFEFTTNRNSARINVQTAHNLVIVPLRINNGPPLNFILDSGVNKTILTEPLIAVALDLEGDRNVNILGLGGERVIRGIRIPDTSIDIGSIRGKGLDLIVIDDEVFNLSEIFGFPVHGIIGYDFLKEFPILINYEYGYIRVYRDRDYRVRRRSHIMPIKLHNNKPYINVRLQGINDSIMDLSLLVDLGASHTLFLNNKYDFLTGDSTITSFIGKGISGEMTGKEGRVNNIELEDIEIRDIIVAYPDTESRIWTEKLNIEWDGLIGGGLFSRFDVVIDYQSKKLILRKNLKFDEPFKPNLSGLDIIAKGPDFNIFKISYVRPSSVAYEAGLKANDRIISLNGKNYKNTTLQDIYDTLSSTPGTEISVVIQRKKYNKNKGEKIKNHFFTFNLRQDI